MPTKTSARPPSRTPAERAALARITPGPLPAIVMRTLRKAQSSLKGTGASVEMGGSSAKGTHLAGDHDVDVFVRFPKKKDGKSDANAPLSDLLENALTKAFRGVERVHGSRDYFHLREGKYTFEFVPVLRISSWAQAENVTDMSPLHVLYVRKRLARRPWLAQDVRLAKQFCKAAKAYGAESYIGGLSGYVVELLTLHYGGFRKMLEAAASWGERAVIDPEGLLEDPERELNPSKTYAPLVIVDPLQPERNSAAALTKERYDALRMAARAYLEAPASAQARFFRIDPLTAAHMRKAHPEARVLEVRLSPLPGKRDVSGAKCAKVFEQLVRELREREFALIEARWEFSPQRALLLFALAKGSLSREREVMGPPISRKDDVARFRAKHPRAFAREGRMHALEAREFTDPARLLAHLCAQAYVRERARSARVVA